MREKIKKMGLSDWIDAMKMILCVLWSKIIRLKKKDIWIFTEREFEARDNAYWLYKYIIENNLHENSYFVISESSPDYSRIKKLNSKVLTPGTPKHFLYTAACTKFISTHLGQGMPNNKVCWQLNKMGVLKFKFCFLQHGVTKNAPNVLKYEKTYNVNYICCVSNCEKEFMHRALGQPYSKLKVLGFCRYDNLNDNSYELNEKKILLFPTWRKWLQNLACADEFLRSDYYEFYNKLITHPRLVQTLKSEKCKLLFMLHPEMQCYSGFFEENENVKIVKTQDVDIQKLINDCKCLVTDYSSLSYDFAYEFKPIIYAHFDYNEFYGNHYARGISDEDEGFGVVTYNLEETVDSLKHLINERFVNDAAFLNRSEEFFMYRDGNNCKRNFEYIVNI